MGSALADTTHDNFAGYSRNLYEHQALCSAQVKRESAILEIFKKGKKTK